MGPDGGFRLGPLAPGRAKIQLLLGGGAPRDLATIEIARGADLARDFDAVR